MTISSSSHGGNVARAARELGLPEKSIIDFSASINPLGAAPGVYRAISEESWKIRHYPDTEHGNLPALLAEHLGVDRENLLLGNGGAELIYLLPRAVKISSALVLAPTFSEYARAVEASGGLARHLFFFRPDQGSPSVEPADHLAGVDALFLCNPNNPTGRLMAREELLPLVDEAGRAGAYVVVDEAFMDFVPARDNFSLMATVCSRPNLVVLYSMTKFFGIPGLRLGAAVASADVISRLKKVKDPWSVNAMALLAGEAALKDRGHMADTLKTVREEREYLFYSLSSIPGMKPFPSETNFLLLDISGTGVSSSALVEKLAVAGILVRNCANFHGLDQRFVRVAVKTREENNALLNALTEVIGPWKWK